jgi:Fuc2NAc and GlcNAc transferase
MAVDLLAAVTGVFMLSLLLTGIIRRVALARGLLDVPNARSSHAHPTPRGGGVAIVLTLLLAVAVMLQQARIPTDLATALLIGGPVIALVGFIDDLRSVSVGTRLIAQFAVFIVCLWILGPLPPVDFGFGMLRLGIVGSIASIVFLVWFLNLFNFMDGIDGIAGVEALSVMTFATALLLWQHGEPSAIWLLLTVCASVAGFLIWNWPPARIFMGDAGSGVLGFVAGTVAWATVVRGHFTLWVWLILFGVFIVDATVTLFRRGLRRQRLFDAHRSHAYQRLSRVYNSHLKVTVGVLLINLLWLDPLAFLAVVHPMLGALLTLIAWLPLITLAWRSGAGVEDI